MSSLRSSMVHWRTRVAFGDGSRPEPHTRELLQQFVNVATVKGGVCVKGGITAG